MISQHRDRRWREETVMASNHLLLRIDVKVTTMAAKTKIDFDNHYQN